MELIIFDKVDDSIDLSIKYNKIIIISRNYINIWNKYFTNQNEIKELILSDDIYTYISNDEFDNEFNEMNMINENEKFNDFEINFNKIFDIKKFDKFKNLTLEKEENNIPLNLNSQDKLELLFIKDYNNDLNLNNQINLKKLFLLKCEINSINFPTNLESIIFDNKSSNNFSLKLLEKLKKIFIKYNNIKDIPQKLEILYFESYKDYIKNIILNGEIENLINLKIIKIYGNIIGKLDFSKNINLIELSIIINNLNSINISNNILKMLAI